jgi:hypothetical protein
MAKIKGWTYVRRGRGGFSGVYQHDVTSRQVSIVNSRPGVFVVVAEVIDPDDVFGMPAQLVVGSASNRLAARSLLLDYVRRHPNG